MVDSRLDYIKQHIPDSQLAREAIFEIERLRAILLMIQSKTTDTEIAELIQDALEQ